MIRWALITVHPKLQRVKRKKAQVWHLIFVKLIKGKIDISGKDKSIPSSQMNSESQEIENIKDVADEEGLNQNYRDRQGH